MSYQTSLFDDDTQQSQSQKLSAEECIGQEKL